MSDRSADPDHAGRARDWLTTLGWAAYLACSWTWCIGMFLPVLLVRDFGLWGFLVFAAPNVIGAGAMGWMLSARGSGRVVVVHGPAVRAFSGVTVLFQAFFVCWLAAANEHLPFGTFAGAVAGAGILAWCFARRRELLGACLTWMTSAAIAWAMWMGGDLGVPDSRPILPESHLLALAPVCVFGFALCPYLDGTFHRARQSLDRGSARAAFGLGFSVLFLAMILFTLLYARQLGHSGDAVRARDHAAPVIALLGVHLLVQVLFTGFAHGTAITEAFGVRRGLWRGAALGMAIVAMFGLLRATSGRHYAGLSTGEVLYRCFMAFYGLVFPAYVWLCVIPTGRGGDGHAGPTHAKVRVWLFTVGVAAPMFWMGFIERQTWWLAPGLGVVLAARLFLPRRSPASL